MKASVIQTRVITNIGIDGENLICTKSRFPANHQRLLWLHSYDAYVQKLSHLFQVRFAVIRSSHFRELFGLILEETEAVLLNCRLEIWQRSYVGQIKLALHTRQHLRSFSPTKSA